MGLISSLVTIEKKFAWSFLGFLLAIIFGLIALYTEFLRDTSPVITYEIVSSTRVLDVREDVGDLSIIYNNEDIRKTKKTLSVMIIRVANHGRSPVLKTYYDNAAKIGLVITNGDIIKGEVIGASTKYLQENANISFTNPKTAEFSDVIIEPKESFDVKFLILSPENAPLAVSPKGKIAGVKQITMLDQASKQNTETFWWRVIAGSIWVQITRVPVYFFGFIITCACVVLPIILVSEFFEKRKRIKTIKQFEAYSEGKYKEINESVYSLYKETGLSMLLKIKNAVTDDEKFETFINTYKKKGKDFENSHEQDLSPSMLIAMDSTPHERRRGLSPAIILKSLVEIGVVSKVDDEFIKNSERVKSMEEFIDFAVIKEA